MSRRRLERVPGARPSATDAVTRIGAPAGTPVARRPDAPRLIEWTGERCVPWAPDPQVVYEHFHRYLWAAALASGRRVLDLGCGEGYGSAILAGSAESVRGIDVDARAVEHARLNYVAPNLSFGEGDATDLGALGRDAFDMVVAFEVIEHLEEHDELLDRVREVLSPDGLLVLSTPDRGAYAQAREEPNPHHARELSEAELRELLGERFEHVGIWGQRATSGSRIVAREDDDAAAVSGFTLERDGEEWRPGAVPPPLYLIAVASPAAFAPPPRDSALHDHGLALLEASAAEAEHAGAELEAARERVAELERQVTAGQRYADTTTTERDEARAAFQHARAEELRLREELEALRADRVADLEPQLRELTRQVIEAHAGREDAEQQVAAAKAEAQRARHELARVDGSVVWQAFQRVRRAVYGPQGYRSLRGRALSALLRTLDRETVAVAAQPDAGEREVPPIRVPRFDRPHASILISTHTNAGIVERCLRQLVRATAGVPYELIVVNDAADAETTRVLDALENATVIVNERNLHFLRSVNRAAEAARGRYLVLLNDDTEVQPGWLEALVECAESDPAIGYVAAKLIYPNGLLQEAGGIVWNDGSGWNYGRHHDAHRPEYNFRRDVDYGSAAAALVRADAWREAGGFDELYAPNYYEDTDLCMALRANGHRVVYEPRAVVIHHEGSSLGTDEAPKRGKHHQDLNRPKFVAKWRAALEAEHLPPPPDTEPWAGACRQSGRHVLVIDHRIPLHDCDSGSRRMFEMLRMLRESGCAVTFLPDNRHAEEPYRSELQELGIEVLYDPVDPHVEFARLADHVQLAIVSRPHVAARYLDALRELMPRALLAYDTVDLHHVREQRAADLGVGSPAKAAALRELELAMIRSSDLTIAISTQERDYVREVAPGARVTVLPNANAVAEVVPPPGDRSGLLFVGGFQHPPNVDAARELVHSVMPRVWRELPDCELTIVGPHATAGIEELASPRVKVTGWVPDLEPLLAGARATVAPLRFGAGMKGKITQSLAVGLPVVTSTIGAEGLHATPGEHILIADEPDAFAAEVVRLCRDDDLWRRLSAAGLELAEQGWSRAAMRRHLEELLATAERWTASTPA
jgi:O-antigen biosynthesis protein